MKNTIKEFENIFEQGYKPLKHGHDQHYGHDDYHGSSHSYNQHNDLKQQLFNRARNNPKLKALLIVAIIIMLIAVVATVILLFPLLMKLFNYIYENGIQGLIDTVWKGTKN